MSVLQRLQKGTPLSILLPATIPTMTMSQLQGKTLTAMLVKWLQEITTVTEDRHPVNRRWNFLLPKQLMYVLMMSSLNHYTLQSLDNRDLAKKVVTPLAQ